LPGARGSEVRVLQAIWPYTTIVDEIDPRGPRLAK
jgi:hypothetical protein